MTGLLKSDAVYYCILELKKSGHRHSMTTLIINGEVEERLAAIDWLASPPILSRSEQTISSPI
jgi:hypothetical protein